MQVVDSNVFRLNNGQYSVLLMTKDGLLQTIGSINTSGYIEYVSKPDMSNVNHEININKIRINSVNIFNENILKVIADDCTYVNTHVKVPFDIDPVKDISGQIFHIMRYRRCTVYLIHQESSRGERILAYLSDRIMHSGECFGTSVKQVSKEEIIREICESTGISKEKIEEQFGI
jgi:hypothetical protein